MKLVIGIVVLLVVVLVVLLVFKKIKCSKTKTS